MLAMLPVSLSLLLLLLLQLLLPPLWKDTQITGFPLHQWITQQKTEHENSSFAKWRLLCRQRRQAQACMLRYWRLRQLEGEHSTLRAVQLNAVRRCSQPCRYVKKTCAQHSNGRALRSLNCDWRADSSAHCRRHRGQSATASMQCE